MATRNIGLGRTMVPYLEKAFRSRFFKSLRSLSLGALGVGLFKGYIVKFCAFQRLSLATSQHDETDNLELRKCPMELCILPRVLRFSSCSQYSPGSFG